MAGIAFALVGVTCQSSVTAERAAATPESRSAKPQPASGACAAWVSDVLRADNAGSERTWRDITIRSLPTACDAIPEGVRAAAARAKKTKDSSESARILAAAAAAALGNRCPIPDAFSDARELGKACPLPQGLRFHFDETILMDIRAVDYGLLLVLLQGLRNAGAYNDAAERLVANFALSAQILGEDFRKGRTRRAPHRD